MFEKWEDMLLFEPVLNRIPAMRLVRLARVCRKYRGELRDRIAEFRATLPTVYRGHMMEIEGECRYVISVYGQANKLSLQCNMTDNEKGTTRFQTLYALDELPNEVAEILSLVVKAMHPSDNRIVFGRDGSTMTFYSDSVVQSFDSEFTLKKTAWTLVPISRCPTTCDAEGYTSVEKVVARMHSAMTSNFT